ncbi:MAG: hypothetical protein ACE5Q3_07725 [Alphaproteobacteria bacterium]
MPGAVFGGVGSRSAGGSTGGFRGGSSGGPGGGPGHDAGGSDVGGSPANGRDNGPQNLGTPDRRLAANADTQVGATRKASLVTGSGYYHFETSDAATGGDFAPSLAQQAGNLAGKHTVSGIPNVVAILCILALLVGAIVAAMDLRRGRPRL